MLARTEMTAADLGITEAELAALRQVRDDLRAGRIAPLNSTEWDSGAAALDMTNWTQCLCAHARRKGVGLFRGADTADINALHPGVRELFTTTLLNDALLQAKRIDRLLAVGNPNA